MASLGVKNLARLSMAAEDFPACAAMRLPVAFRRRQVAAGRSNTWGGTRNAEFIAAAYDIKSDIVSLTDAAVGECTNLAALTAKATTFVSGPGLLRIRLRVGR